MYNDELNPYSFKSTVYSLSRLIIGGISNDLGLVIPDFQRDFTWEEIEIKRFFNDLLVGYSKRMDNITKKFINLQTK